MSKKQPWQKIKNTEVYSNPWITLNHHDIINPSGKPGIYGQVHFKNYAIGIIPLDSDMNTWLVGQDRFALDQYSWEIPMGGGPLDVPILESAQRELKEETGIIAQSWNQIMKLHTSNCVCDEVGYVYLAEGLTYGEPDFDETEDLQIKMVPFLEAYQMAMEGEITDAISVAGILKTAILRKLV